MKKKNLILSLFCSIILTIGLVTFTIVSLVSNNKVNGGNNIDHVNQIEKEVDNEQRDGSEELPYVIYDLDDFYKYVVGKYTDEDGNYIDYNAVTEEGELAYPELKAGLNYELALDLDFAGKEFVTLFNKGIPFNGTINANGKTIKNVTISVTKENLEKFMYEKVSAGYRAHIALFGMLNNAKILDLNVASISISVDSEILEYLRNSNTTFVEEYKNVMYELTVGTVAGLAFDSTISANVDGSISAFSYVYREDAKAQGTNAIGGLVASAVNTDISSSKANVEMNLAGTNYFVGGLVAKAYNVTANSVSANAKVKANYNQTIYVGGAFGYVQGVSVDGAEITLAVSENGDRISADMLEFFSSEKIDEFINIAGIVPFVRANNESQKATFKNVNTKTNVSIDGVYAGAVVDVWSTANKSVKTVEFENVQLDSTFDTLKAFGFARTLANTKVITKLNVEEQAGKFDLIIAGNVRFNEKSFNLIISYADDIASTFGENGYEELTIMMDRNLEKNLSIAETFIKNNLMKEKRFEYIAEEVA